MPRPIFVDTYSLALHPKTYLLHNSRNVQPLKPPSQRNIPTKAITGININIPDVSSHILEAWYPVIHEIHRTNRPTRQAVVTTMSLLFKATYLPYLSKLSRNCFIIYL